MTSDSEYNSISHYRLISESPWKMCNTVESDQGHHPDWNRLFFFSRKYGTQNFKDLTSTSTASEPGLSASVDIRTTKLLTNGSWALAGVWCTRSVIITPHILAVSSLKDLRRSREELRPIWLRRRFGHDVKGEESGNDGGGDSEFHGPEFFFSVIFGTARKSAVIMQNEEGSISPVRILKLGWVTWVPSRMFYL